MTRIKKILECPICLDKFSKPKILPCSHTFCLECIKPDENTGEITCAICRNVTKLPKSGLLSNIQISDLLEIDLDNSMTKKKEPEFKPNKKRSFEDSNDKIGKKNKTENEVKADDDELTVEHVEHVLEIFRTKHKRVQELQDLLGRPRNKDADRWCRNVNPSEFIVKRRLYSILLDCIETNNQLIEELEKEYDCFLSIFD